MIDDGKLEISSSFLSSFKLEFFFSKFFFFIVKKTFFKSGKFYVEITLKSLCAKLFY